MAEATIPMSPRQVASVVVGRTGDFFRFDAFKVNALGLLTREGVMESVDQFPHVRSFWKRGIG
jgi:hypothetical protein